MPILLSAGLVAFQRLAHYRVEVLRWLDLDNACSVLNARVSLVGDVAGRGDWQCCVHWKRARRVSSAAAYAYVWPFYASGLTE